MCLPDYILELASEFFLNCKFLESVTLPKNPTKIGERAFKGCENLRKINVSNSGFIIEKSAFSGCGSLVCVDFLDGVKEIKSSVFENCTALKQVFLPQSLVKIGERAFSGCTGLEQLEIPRNIEDIDDSAFNGCISLKKVIIPTMRFFNYEFIERFSALECVEFKEGIKKIENFGFVSSWCGHGKDNEVREIIIPDGVETIGYAVFNNCVNLTEITLPKSVKEIEENAFENCKRLKKVRIKATECAIHENAFKGCNTITIVCCEQVKKLNEALSNCEFVSFEDEYPKVKKEVGGKKVKINKIKYAIDGENAFVIKQKTRLKEIVIPSSITFKGKTYPVIELCEEAFRACKEKYEEIYNIPLVYALETGIEKDTE